MKGIHNEAKKYDTILGKEQWGSSILLPSLESLGSTFERTLCGKERQSPFPKFNFHITDYQHYIFIA